MKYDLVIFDLDGTVLDTLSDIANACNAALTSNGFPARTREEVRRFVGSGLARLVQLALPEGEDAATAEKVLSDLKEYYAAHVNVETAPYPGMIDLMKKLRAARIRVAINSNKVDSASQALCRMYFDGLTDCVLGERAGLEKKPSPQGAHRIMAELGVSAARTLYVGDSNIDVLTAKNAGIDCAWVSWGFRSREELGELEILHPIHSAEALEKLIFGR